MVNELDGIVADAPHVDIREQPSFAVSDLLERSADGIPRLRVCIERKERKNPSYKNHCNTKNNNNKECALVMQK